MKRAMLTVAMMAAGLQLRGGEAARCLEDEQQRGSGLSAAVSRCLGEVSDLLGELKEAWDAIADQVQVNEQESTAG